MKQVLRIHWISATILCLIVTAMARPLAAQEIKLGYVNAERVLKASKSYKDAEAQFEKQRDAWNQEIDTRSRELKAMEDDFKAQELMLSDEKKRTRLQELQTRQQELEQYYQQIFGPSGEAVRKQEELLEPILDKVQGIINEVGEQEKYTMIFDSSSLGIAYAAEGVDLTEVIIERLNASE